MILCNQCGQAVDNDLGVCLECFADTGDKPAPPFASAAVKTNLAPNLGGAPSVRVGTRPAPALDDDAPTIVGAGRAAVVKVSDTTPPAAPERRWKRVAVCTAVAASVLAVALTVALVKLSNTGSSLAQEQGAKGELETRNAALLSKLTSVETKLGDAERELQKATDARQTLAERWPLTVTDIRLLNGPEGASASEFTGSITWAATSKIFWRATVQNNLYSFEPVSGSLCVKFIRPGGALYTDASSPSGCTRSELISLSDRETFTATLGFGGDNGYSFTRGANRVELWWAGRRIAEKSFYVTD
ncbi:MAG TPA: hypothetical protein VER32_01290 [Pyrinomonadaceae bacterium]|nr:hypothetical protein [Pyrinomonadaceae bacterium]